MTKRRSRGSDGLQPLGDCLELQPLGDCPELLPLGDCPELLPVADGVEEIQTIGDVIADLQKMDGVITTEGVQSITDVAADLNLIARGANATTNRAQPQPRPLNRRQLKFARALASGAAPIEAQRISGFKQHRGNAARLARDRRVVTEQKRIEFNRWRLDRKRRKAELQ